MNCFCQIQNYFRITFRYKRSPSSSPKQTHMLVPHLEQPMCDWFSLTHVIWNGLLAEAPKQLRMNRSRALACWASAHFLPLQGYRCFTSPSLINNRGTQRDPALHLPLLEEWRGEKGQQERKIFKRRNEKYDNYSHLQWTKISKQKSCVWGRDHPHQKLLSKSCPL